MAKMQRKGNPPTLLVGMQLVQSLWKTVWRFLKKLKMELPYNPVIALLGIYPKDTNIVIQRSTCTSMFVAAMSTTANCAKSRDVH